MPTYIRIAEPKTFPPPHLVLGVPLAIWAIALLLIGMSAQFNLPIAPFDPQDLLTPF
ncbi:MAG TPA: hypothetical protein VFL62_22935 [Bradyrhizobium sp.]|uniref:hypothetical protein n=1 Tax=Bradyrhizobium sp. TaxID=376 RepID=UPI002D7F9F70|nr:hypothetical protein [Bradyrhizobium sp.]HET7889094.1 hypothetical protein [Bradyrhizobium sp.]